MNEEQRLQAGLATKDRSKPDIIEKDYSKYFESVYSAPSLKEAKKRGKEEVEYHDNFANRSTL